MFKKWEAHILSEKLVDQLGRRKWESMVWEGASGWVYGAQSRDEWWMIAPNFVHGEMNGFAAYLRDEPNPIIAARWVDFGATPHDAMIKAKVTVEAERHRLSVISREASRTFMATLNRRDDDDYPYALEVS